MDPAESTKAAAPTIARPAFDEVFLAFASKLAERATCHRLRVGCVITSDDHREVYGFGYNGTADGLPHGCDSPTPGACGCVHAEDGAVSKCKASRRDPKIVYCTHLPCVACAKRFINLGGVQRVVYLHDYRLRHSLALFEARGITVERYEGPGVFGG
jgi:dCMP deaminase